MHATKGTLAPILLAIAAVFCASVLAQNAVSTGSMSGVVSDVSGQVIVNASASVVD